MHSPSRHSLSPPVKDEAIQLMRSGDSAIIVADNMAHGRINVALHRLKQSGSLGHAKKAENHHTTHMSAPTTPQDSHSPSVQVPMPGSINKNSVVQADILNFVTKQQSKSIATKELLRHLVFTVIFLTIVALQRSVFQSYLMNQSISAAFVTQQIDPSLQPFPKAFFDLGQNEELRDFLISVVGWTLDENVRYNGVPLTPYQRNFIMNNNRLLGGVRFRQLRAAPNKDCKVSHSLGDITEQCYAYGYSDRNKDIAPFGPDYDPEKYTYQNAAECGSAFVYTNILMGLEGGGYVVDMPLGSNFTEQIRDLIADGWWDSATRGIIITMNFLSVDLGSHVAVLYLILELPGNGEVMPSVVFKTFRLELYATGTDWFRLVLELLFVTILIHMIVTEVKEIKESYGSKRGLSKYFNDGWNWLEVTNIVLFLAAIGAYLNYAITATQHPDLATVGYFPDLERVATLAWTYYTITYFNILLLCFQTFKYLRMNRRLYMLWKTLQYAGTDLFGFLFIFLIFVFGFVFVAWLAFGDGTPLFSTFNSSFGTCWNFLIGNPPDYSVMMQANPILGPIFYTLFTIFIFFILANVFIAILGNSFSVVSKSVSDQVGLKEAINTKISNCYKSTKKIAKKISKGSKAKRSILQILETLSYPDILEKPGLTIDDVLQACGPDTTEAEAWELFEWIEKLESKRKQQTFKYRKGSIDDYTFSDDEGSSTGVEMKAMQKSNYLELLATVDALRDDMQRLLQLIPQPPSPQPSPVLSQPPPEPIPIVVVDPPSSPPPSPSPSPVPPSSPARDAPASPRVPPLPILSIYQAVQLGQSISVRDSLGPPPPTPNLRNSNIHHIPTIPPPPLPLHSHVNDVHYIHSHDHTPLRQSHDHATPLRISHDHTHSRRPPLSPILPHFDQRTPSSSTNSSPANSPPPSPAIRPSPLIPSSLPIFEPPSFVLDHPENQTSTTPRLRVDL